MDPRGPAGLPGRSSQPNPGPPAPASACVGAAVPTRCPGSLQHGLARGGAVLRGPRVISAISDLLFQGN